MKRAVTADESGVVSILSEGNELSSESIVHACHSILDAAASLVMNVELMANGAGESEAAQSVSEDVRASVERIAKVARALQTAALARSAAA